MRKNGKTKNRPEENLVYEIIQTHCSFRKLEDQHHIVYINEQDVLKDAFVDIHYMDRFGDVIIRIMGPYHDETTQSRKDVLQSAYLTRDGYVVVDVWYYNCPAVFLRNERMLGEFELEQAFAELKAILKPIIRLPPKPDKDWLKNSEHRNKNVM